MTRTEYLEKLREQLHCFSSDMQEEILEDYNRHFDEGLANGKSEEEIIAELGSIEDMVEELKQTQPEDTVSPQNQSSSYDGAYRTIQLEGGPANVIVQLSEDNRIHIHYENNGNETLQQKYRFFQYEQDGNLYAGVQDTGVQLQNNKETKRFRLFGIPLFSYESAPNPLGNITLTVKLPKETPALVVKNGSGNVQISGLTFRTLHTVAGSGDTKLNRILCEQMECRTGSGNISFADILFADAKMHTGSGNISGSSSDGKPAGTLSGQTGSGNIRIHSAFGNCYLQTGSGNISYHSPHSLQDAALQTGSGNISVMVNQTEGLEAGVKTGSGNVRICWKEDTPCTVKSGTFTFGNGETKLRTNTGSGNVEIIAR